MDVIKKVLGYIVVERAAVRLVLLEVIGFVIIEAMLTALAVGMVIAMATCY